MPTNAMSAQEFLGRAHAQLLKLNKAYQDLRGARGAHGQTVEELDEARKTALDELTAACLPALTPEAVARVKPETGYGRFTQDDPFAYMERRRAFLQNRVREIEADPRYTGRSRLIDPVTGELTLQLDQITRDAQVLEESLARYAAEPMFQTLYDVNYDTERYAYQWWQLSYYKHWKHGDLIAERFGQGRFADVRAAYEHVQNAYNAVQRDLADVRRKISEVEGLVTEREQSLSGLETLPQDTLASCRKMLREHIEHIDRADLARWLAGDPGRVGTLKRLHGIERKIDYLEEMAARQYGNEDEALRRAISKLQRKVEKFQRPKNAYAMIPMADAQSWLADPTPKLAERRAKFRNGYDRVERFDRYDAFDYAGDMLWWDLMTDGRIDGNFIPEVNDWNAQHPNYSRGDDLAHAGSAFAPSNEPAWSGLDEVS